MRSPTLPSLVLSAGLAFTASFANAAESTSQSIIQEETESLTAEGLSAWVLEVNPGLAAIRATAEAAAYRIEIAGSLNDPKLSYGVSPRTISADRGLNQKINFSQAIPWPGTLAARESAARHAAVAVDRDVDALRLQVVAQAKSAYAEWQFVHSALTIHHASQLLLDELIVTTETRYAAGSALRQDVLQAEIERSDLENQLLKLQRLEASVQARINALLNRAPEQPLAKAVSMGLPVEQLPDLAWLQNRALAQHPALLRLGAQISERESRTALAEKAFYPNFEVGVGYNGLWEDPNKRIIVGVSINVPLDRSKRRSELNRAKAKTRSAEWALVERRAQLLAELAETRAKVFETQSSITLYQNRLVPLAAEYLTAAVADYQSGKGAFLNVITAEKYQLTMKLALARAKADYIRRTAALERWVGGAFNANTLTQPTQAGI